MPDPLDSFSEPVRFWFQETFGEPTPPQAQGWPAIQRGEHTLILAPTGSGKTLAAFLWGIDRIYREILADAAPGAGLAGERPGSRAGAGQGASTIPSAGDGVRLLYISPLKALNNDIERNLRAPLEGIRAAAARLGQAWPHLRVAVRTGDTPSQARAQMVKRPPHILITTPESLYLILTSPRARHMLRSVQTVIVDEIHTLCGNKRGVHLALTLERLERLASEQEPGGQEAAGGAAWLGRSRAAGVQRIGLSATQRPLEEVARFLGGQAWAEAGELVPRPVTIVDTGYRKRLDLQVVTVVEDFGSLPGNTIWPSVVARLLGDIRRHRTTLVFANNRRLAERTADRLNAQLAAEETEEIPPGSVEALAPGGVVRDRGMFALGAQGPIRAHHGSMSKDARRKMEEDLKAGRLPALVGTSSLELGIDIGTVDLVAQLQSPKSVAQGLQRVGRSGHLVGQTSTGRIYATFREDLVEAAAIARGMLEGDIEPTYTPQNPLDVLAQQVLAMVAVEEWSVPALYRLVRQAYPYHALPERAFRLVLDMLAGKYYNAALAGGPAQAAAAGPEGAARPERSSAEDGPGSGPQVMPQELAAQEPVAQAAARPGGPALSALRARLSWDRVNDRLAPLPGARMLAVSNAGTIPDTGAYSIYLADGRTRIGELDEEFVFETRPGDAFLFGSQVWRVLEIGDDRLVVAPAPGTVPRMPFWHGDYPWRPYELGQRIGRFRAEIAERVRAIGLPEDDTIAGEAGGAPGASAEQAPRLAELEAWLRREYALDTNSARNLIAHVRGQLEAIGLISSDRRIVAEYFQDAVGEYRLVLHSPFGGRVNGAWAIALRSALREQIGTEPEIMANDDGIIFRFPQLAGLPPVDLITGMGPAEARERILRELPAAAVFGAQFRMAAGRALLLPRARGGKRTPFWLQRLKAKDLLAVVRGFGDFPLVAEAYRACLQDVLDLAHLEEVLAQIQAGGIQVVPVHTALPSPIASALLLYFMNTYIYEWDAPKAERDLQALALRREVLSDVLAERADLHDLLRPEAVESTAAESQHRAPGRRARSAEELAVMLAELGDLSTAEVAAICAGPASGGGGAGAMPEGGTGPLAGAGPANGQLAAAQGWLAELATAGRVVELSIPTARGLEARWVPAELAPTYRQAFSLPPAGQAASATAGDPGLPAAAAPGSHESPAVDAPIGDALAAPQAVAAAAATILRRYLAHAGPVTRAAILDRYAFPEAWLDDQLAQLVEAKVVARGRFTAQAGADEFCDMAALEQMHRRTLSQLRREVQPVPLSTYASFLAGWQHLAPARRLAGPEGLAQIMRQLRGTSLPAPAWESQVLPARLVDFHPPDLAALCGSGGLVWVAAGSDAQHARLRFFFRGEGDLFLGRPDESGLSGPARAVYDYLRAEGASFLADMLSGLGLRREALAPALAELALAGLATNDSLAALAAVLASGGGAQAGEEQIADQAGPAPAGRGRQPLSPLEADLARRLAGKPRPLTPTRYRAAKREARRRLAVGPLPASGRGRPAGALQTGGGEEDSRRNPVPADLGAGRWSLVHRAAVLGPAGLPEERAARQARVLLDRYGIVTRDWLAREDAPYDWPALYAYLQRLEMRGEVRRGYFVAGLSGAQFALPEAVEALRAVAGFDAAAQPAAAAPAEDAMIVLNATDPANIFGGELPGAALPAAAAAEHEILAGAEAAGQPETAADQAATAPGGQLRFARVPSTDLVLWRGRPVLVAEDHGARLSVPAGVSSDLIRQALAAYLDRPAAHRHLVVAAWNGAPVWGSPGEAVLQALGFYRSPAGMEWWRSAG